jgi:hypothetical protein
MDSGIHVRHCAEAFGQVFSPIKLFGKYSLGMLGRFALFGGKRVSDKGYYVNGFFESP